MCPNLFIQWWQEKQAILRICQTLQQEIAWLNIHNAKIMSSSNWCNKSLELLVRVISSNKKSPFFNLKIVLIPLPFISCLVTVRLRWKVIMFKALQHKATALKYEMQQQWFEVGSCYHLFSTSKQQKPHCDCCGLPSFTLRLIETFWIAENHLHLLTFKWLFCIVQPKIFFCVRHWRGRRRYLFPLYP